HPQSGHRVSRKARASVMADPSAAELNLLNDLAAIYDWAGVSRDLRGTLATALGMPTKIRDMVFVNRAAWDLTVGSLTLAGATAADLRTPVPPVQQGRLEVVRRVCLLRCGMPVDTPGSSIASSSSGAGGTSSAAGAQQGASDPGSPAGRKLRLSSVVDQTLDADVVPLGQLAIQAMFTDYETRFGAEPHPDVEPTSDQLSALSQLTKSGSVPYADFSVFGPYGQRLLRKLVFVSFTLSPSGDWQRRELPGPPEFETWWRCWRVYKVAMLLLDVADPERLEAYGEHIRGLRNTYVDSWFLVYQADVRMRSEHFERLRRRLAAKPDFNYSGARPWNAVFAQAVRESEFWATEVKEPAIRWEARGRQQVRSPATGSVPSIVVQEQESQLGGQGGGGAGSNKKSRAKRKHSGDDLSSFDEPAGVYKLNRKGLEICRLFNEGRCGNGKPQSKCTGTPDAEPAAVPAASPAKRPKSSPFSAFPPVSHSEGEFVPPSPSRHQASTAASSSSAGTAAKGAKGKDPTGPPKSSSKAVGAASKFGPAVPTSKRMSAPLNKFSPSPKVSVPTPKRGRDDRVGLPWTGGVYGCWNIPPSRDTQRLRVLRLFSGPSARPDGLAAELFKRGWNTCDVDIVATPACDVLDDTVWAAIMQDLSAGLYDLVFARTLCGTFSSLRGQGDGPGPLRSFEKQEGLDQSSLSPHEWLELKQANLTVWRSAEAFHTMYHLGRAFILENPAPLPGGVSLFRTEAMQNVARLRGVKFVEFHQCPFGAETAKPTRFLYYGLDLSALGEHKCIHPVRTWTDLTGQTYRAAHERLQGPTRALAAYPGRLNQELANQISYMWDARDRLRREAELAAEVIPCMWNPRSTLRRLPRARRLGAAVGLLLDKAMDVFPELLPVTDLLDGKASEGFRPEVIAILKKSALSLLGVSESAEECCKSSLSAAVISGWCNKTDDPDAILGDWLLEGAPMGFTRDIPNTGVFTPVCTDNLGDDDPDFRDLANWSNYSSAVGSPDEVEKLLDKARRLGFCNRFPNMEAASEFLSRKPLLNKLGLIAKLLGDGTFKFRLIWDLKESKANLACKMGERIILPRLQDFIVAIVEMLAHRRARSSPTIWGRYAAWLGRTVAAVTAGRVEIQVYVDDPVLAAVGTAAERRLSLTEALLWMSISGFPIAWRKASGGAAVEWAGAHIEVCDDFVRVTVPKSKILKLLAATNDILSRSVVGRRVLRSYAGSMSFIAGLVSPLRPFLSCLWAVLSTKSEPDSKRKVKFAKGLIHVKRLRSALELFAAFFHGESGGLLREYRPRTLCNVFIATDASPWGYGGILVVNDRFPLGLAVRIKSDSRGALGAILKLSSPSPLLNIVVREIALDLSSGSYLISVLEHIPGVTNFFPDALSRQPPCPDPKPFPVELATANRTFIPARTSDFWRAGSKKWANEASKAAVLADFEGEMPGHGGELSTGQFLETSMLDSETLEVPYMPPDGLFPLGLLLDLRCAPCVQVLKDLMENPSITKVMWGADGDCQSLCYQTLPVPLCVSPAAVVDAQLAFSTGERRLGMGRMLERVPPELLVNMPDKDHVDWDAFHSLNKRALQLPLSQSDAAYAMDDLHRIEAILGSQPPPDGSYIMARGTTQLIIDEIVADTLGLKALRRSEFYFRKNSGRRRLSCAVQLMRHFQSLHGRGLEIGSEDQDLQALEAEVAEELRVAEVQVAADLSFDGDLCSSARAEKAPEEDYLTASRAGARAGATTATTTERTTTKETTAGAGTAITATTTATTTAGAGMVGVLKLDLKPTSTAGGHPKRKGLRWLAYASFWPAAESHGENLRKGRKLWNWAAESHIWGRCERWDAAVTGCTLHNESRCSDHLSSGPENPDLEITLGNLTPSRNGSDVHLQWWAPRKSEVPWNPQDNDLTGCAVYWDMLKAYPRYNASDFNGGNVRVSENGEATLRVHSPATYLVGRMWVATPHIHLRLCSNESFAHTKQDAVIFTGEGVYAVGTQTYSDLTIVNFTNLTWAAEVGKGPPNDTVNIAGMLVSSRRRSTTVVPTTTSSLADKSTDESEETTFTTSTQGPTTTTAAATTSASSGTNVTETSTGAPSTVAPSTSATSASTNVSTSQPASGQTVIVVTGILDPIVPDCNQFVSTFGTQDSLASGIAEVAGVKQSDVAVSMKCADSARLLATGDAPFRQLGGESVHVNYQITVSVEEGFADGSTSGTSGATAESVTAAIKKETPASLTSRIGAALQDNGITTITLTVETIAEPQVERMIRTTSLAPAQTTSTSASSTSSEATTSMWIDASTTLMPISSSATPDWRLNSSFKDFKKPMTAMNLDALEFSPIYQ
ncbi:unnamed protein product, partial [Polarella glacialis]